MKVAVVGTGYVGLVTAVCLADAGSDVVAVDIDAAKVERLRGGECPIFEPGLQEMLQANLAARRLRFTTSLAEGVAHGQVIFIGVGTPPRADGSADLSAIEATIRGVGREMASAKVIVIKSTVPVGTGRRMSAILEELTAHPFTLVSNPEFLKEGAAVDDFLRPDRVIIGTEDPVAIQLLRELYAPFVGRPQDILVMSREAAEMTKYASNACLATRISFINEIAEICTAVGVDVNAVRTGMGADRRIGSSFLNPGAGYGGSCFPKDVQALIRVAEQAGCEAGVLRSVHERNERQKETLAQMVMARLGDALEGKAIAIWGLAFKPKTDDIREAPSVRIIQRLSQAGARLHCYDPKAAGRAAVELAGLGNVRFFDDPYAALEGASALVICTEWNEFRTPDFDRIRAALAQRIIFDGRNLYEPTTMLRERIEYHSIGRPAVRPVNHAAALAAPLA